MWMFREPRQALSWLASRPNANQIGRIMLFTLTLRHAGYLTLPMSPVTGPEIFYWTVYFYPALVVLWGLWKARQVIGWSMLWFMGLNAATIYVAAMIRAGSATPFGDGVSLALIGWGLLPFDVATLLIIYAVWFWDKRLPAPNADHRQRTKESGSQENRAVRFSLLGSTVLFMLLGLSLLLLILYRDHPGVVAMDGLSSSEERGASLLLPEDRQQEDFAVFHMVSLTTLASLLFCGVWIRRSAVVEAGVWLLVPGQAITVAWPPWQPFLIAATLTGWLLCILALWHHGFPMALRQTRRGGQEGLEPAPRKAGGD